MKTVTITLPAELDAAAAREARRRGISKSALVREGLVAVISDMSLDASVTGVSDDLWVGLSGFAATSVRTSEGAIDDVVYGT